MKLILNLNHLIFVSGCMGYRAGGNKIIHMYPYEFIKWSVCRHIPYHIYIYICFVKAFSNCHLWFKGYVIIMIDLVRGRTAAAVVVDFVQCITFSVDLFFFFFSLYTFFVLLKHSFVFQSQMNPIRIRKST